MKCAFRLTPVSPAGREAVRFYYDVCPESPDGRRLIYFAFDGAAPGPGRVMVADRDGSDARPLGPPQQATPHGVMRHLWVDDDTVAVCPGDAGRLHTLLISLRDGSQRSVPGALRMVSPAAPLGLTTRHDFEPLPSRFDDAVCLMDLQTGALRTLFTMRDALRRHPLGDAFPAADLVGFMHTKWSPGGRRFLVMASNIHRVAADDQTRARVNAVFVADADGANLRYVMEEYHHPVWGADDDHLCLFRKRTDGATDGDRWWGGYQDLMAVPVGGGEARPLVRGMAGKHATLSADGTKALADATNWPERGRGAILVYDVASRTRETLVALRQDDFSQRGCHLHPTWSRDGRRVYFDCMESGRRRVYAVDL